MALWRPNNVQIFTNGFARDTLLNLTHGLSIQIRRLRIEIEKLQWLHQQELSEMKHNLGESDRLISKVLCTRSSSLTKHVTGFTRVRSSSRVLQCRAHNGRDEAKSGTGEREVGERGEETDGAREAAGGGRDQEEAVVR